MRFIKVLEQCLLAKWKYDVGGFKIRIVVMLHVLSLRKPVLLNNGRLVVVTVEDGKVENIYHLIQLVKTEAVEVRMKEPEPIILSSSLDSYLVFCDYLSSLLSWEWGKIRIFRVQEAPEKEQKILCFKTPDLIREQRWLVIFDFLLL
jgi:hypothetical protein